MNTCRFCKKDSDEKRLFKYAVRHYACADCGLTKLGPVFLDLIPEHELGNLPYRALQSAHLLAEVESRIGGKWRDRVR